MPVKLLSVVFSFRNEEEVLPELLRRTRAVLASEKAGGRIAHWELIFVNDASSDRSLEVLIKEAQGHHDITIITMSRTFGVGPCVVAGMAHARGDAVVYMDADLQDPPELVPQLLEAMQAQNAEVVHTQRRTRRGETTFKLYLTKIGYALLNRYSSVPMPPEVGDFKLLSRRVVDEILKLKEYRPYMRGLVSYVGFKQIFVPYDRQPRFAGKSKFFILGFKAVSNFLNSVISFSSVPLQIASYCGLGAILIVGLIVIHALYQKLMGTAVPGWTALMCVVLFIGGVQLFCIGMIGLYLKSIHDQTKSRPNYIIESIDEMTAG
jgi:glycosyltransferase involved in cell wall biosynthesis